MGTRKIYRWAEVFHLVFLVGKETASKSEGMYHPQCLSDCFRYRKGNNELELLSQNGFPG